MAHFRSLNVSALSLLALPTTSKIHPIFHCSLKLHQGPLPPTLDTLPPSHDNHPLVEPLTILDSKMDTHTSPPTKMVLVQWLGLALEDTSWEKWDDLCFVFYLEDKVVFPAGGDDSIKATMTQETRPKRDTKKPKYLEDYI